MVRVEGYQECDADEGGGEGEELFNLSGPRFVLQGGVGQVGAEALEVAVEIIFRALRGGWFLAPDIGEGLFAQAPLGVVAEEAGEFGEFFGGGFACQLEAYEQPESFFYLIVFVHFLLHK